MKKRILILVFTGFTAAGWAQRYDPEVDGPFFKYKPTTTGQTYQPSTASDEEEEETRSRKRPRRARKQPGSEPARNVPPARTRRQRCDESDQ